MKIYEDKRTILTLDAGGSSLRFSAIQAGVAVVETVTMPSDGHDLTRCLANIVNGFAEVRQACGQVPVAISFAFPGPADYPNGVIGDLVNLPCFRGGVALGPMLREEFGLPVFINNDGDLFTYGEAIAGLLPQVNGWLKEVGSPKRYRNLLGITVGTGFGGGIVRDGELFVGDNSIAGEICRVRNKIEPSLCAEEGACIRALRRGYAKQAKIAFHESPDPMGIEKIAEGQIAGDREAALLAFQAMGEVIGDAIANALTLIDGLAVMGGGISKAHRLFLPQIMSELNGRFVLADGQPLSRLVTRAFNLEDSADRACFLKGELREVTIPGTTKTIKYDALQRVGVGVSRLGTSEAIAIGAYAYALNQLDQGA